MGAGIAVGGGRGGGAFILKIWGMVSLGSGALEISINERAYRRLIERFMVAAFRIIPVYSLDDNGNNSTDKKAEN